MLTVHRPAGPRILAPMSQRGRTISEPYPMADFSYTSLYTFVGEQEPFTWSHGLSHNPLSRERRESSGPTYREPAVRDPAETPRWLTDASHQLTGEHPARSQGTMPRRRSQNAAGRESRDRSETPSWLRDASNYLKVSGISEPETSEISEPTSVPYAKPSQSPATPTAPEREAERNSTARGLVRRGAFLMCCIIRGKPLAARNKESAP